MTIKTSETSILRYRTETSKKVCKFFFVGLLLQLGLTSALYAGTGNFTQYTATASNGFLPQVGTNQFKVAINNHLPPTNCEAGQNPSYLAIFIGGPGNFIGSDDGQTSYYKGAAQTIAEKLDSQCVRTVIVETTTRYLNYSGNNSTTSADPINNGAAYIYDMLVALQANTFLNNPSLTKPTWYLMGGSAGSLMSVKLVDNNFTAPGRSTNLDRPAGVILESLPTSGSVYTDCQETSGSSSFDTIVPGIFGGTKCSAIKNNTSYISNSTFEFLNGSGIKNYMDQGNKIFIMQGANDPLFKAPLSVISGDNNAHVSNHEGWTMVGVLKNFATVTGLAATCGREDGGTYSASDDLKISNTQKTWSCYSQGLYARTYVNGAHGPVSNNSKAVDDLGWVVSITE